PCHPLVQEASPMRSLLSKKRAKPRPFTHLFIEQLETRLVPSATLVLRGTDNLQHTSAATEETLGNFELRTLQTFPITLRANGIGTGGSISWSMAYFPGYADDATLAPATNIVPNSGILNNSGPRVTVNLTFTSSLLANGTYHGQLRASGSG